jgi:hypothetical protein
MDLVKEVGHLKVCIGPVRLCWKTSWNTVSVNFLWEKNIVSAEKTSWKVRIISRVNRAIDRNIISSVHDYYIAWKYITKWNRIYITGAMWFCLFCVNWDTLYIHPTEFCEKGITCSPPLPSSPYACDTYARCR